MCVSNLVYLYEGDLFGSHRFSQPLRYTKHGYRDTILSCKDKEYLSYSREQLLDIENRVKEDKRLCILDYDACVNIRKCSAACVNIRKCKLNKRKRGKRGGSSKQKQTGVDLKNLITAVNIDNTNKISPNLRMCLMNTQSIKNKECTIMDYILENKIDVCFVTETWLSDDDNIWIEGSDFNKFGYNIDVSNRPGRRGGGVGVIHKCNIQISMENKGVYSSFDYAEWSLSIKNEIISAHVIYHPPYSELNRATDVRFIEEVTEYWANTLMPKK